MQTPIPSRGFFGIGIYHNKSKVNIGTLWRSAYQLGSSFVFTIGRRYKKQSSDTCKSWRYMPLYHYKDLTDFFSHVPYDSRVVGIEMGGHQLHNFVHPERAIYLLGAEDHGLPDEAIDLCHNTVELLSIRQSSYNVAVAGSLVMYDRIQKIHYAKPRGSLPIGRTVNNADLLALR